MSTEGEPIQNPTEVLPQDHSVAPDKLPGQTAVDGQIKQKRGLFGKFLKAVGISTLIVGTACAGIEQGTPQNIQGTKPDNRKEAPIKSDRFPDISFSCGTNLEEGTNEIKGVIFIDYLRIQKIPETLQVTTTPVDEKGTSIGETSKKIIAVKGQKFLSVPIRISFDTPFISVTVVDPESGESKKIIIPIIKEALKKQEHRTGTTP